MAWKLTFRAYWTLHRDMAGFVALDYHVMFSKIKYLWIYFKYVIKGKCGSKNKQWLRIVKTLPSELISGFHVFVLEYGHSSTLQSSLIFPAGTIWCTCGYSWGFFSKLPSVIIYRITAAEGMAESYTLCIIRTGILIYELSRWLIWDVIIMLMVRISSQEGNFLLVLERVKIHFMEMSLLMGISNWSILAWGFWQWEDFTKRGSIGGNITWTSSHKDQYSKLRDCYSQTASWKGALHTDMKTKPKIDILPNSEYDSSLVVQWVMSVYDRGPVCCPEVFDFIRKGSHWEVCCWCFCGYFTFIDYPASQNPDTLPWIHICLFLGLHDHFLNPNCVDNSFNSCYFKNNFKSSNFPSLGFF